MDNLSEVFGVTNMTSEENRPALFMENINTSCHIQLQYGLRSSIVLVILVIDKLCST